MATNIINIEQSIPVLTVNEIDLSLSSELVWLYNKKIGYLAQLKQFQDKCQRGVKKIIQVNMELKSKNQGLSSSLQQSKIRIADLNTQLQTNQTESSQTILHLQSQIQTLTQSLSQSHLEHSHSLTLHHQTQQSLQGYKKKLEQNERALQLCTKQQQKTIQQLTQQHNRNIELMIIKYEKLISQQVIQIQKKYQEEINRINQNNKFIVKELEEQVKVGVGKEKERERKLGEDCQRLVGENKRLMQVVNQGKRKNLGLESEIQTVKQESRLVLREKQLIITNHKRQLQILKQLKGQLEQKIKKAQLFNDDSKWQTKQMLLQKQKEVRKIKEESQKMMDELANTYRAQVSTYKTQIAELKDSNDILSRKNQQLKRQRDSARQATQYLKHQLQSLQSQPMPQPPPPIQQQPQKHKLEASQLRKQLLRKNAQLQVQKQEIQRLKSKINKITIAYQQNIKTQQIMDKENKMLLSEIVFLRDKNKSKIIGTNKKGNNGSMIQRNDSKILELRSQQSEILDNVNDNQELEMYKELIVEMEKDMNQAVAKLDQKNAIIDKQKAIIQRLERALSK